VPNRGSCANDCRFDYEMYIEKDDKLERIDDNTIYIKSPEHESYFKLEEYSEGTYLLNAKDLNLASYIDKILESGIVDSVKIEGRTKSPYYCAITTKTYRRAIDDFYAGKFDSSCYQNELNTLKNRGFSEGYLIQRPNEKLDTQNHLTAISEGTYQVVAEIVESGKYLMCKYKIYPNDTFEIVLPSNDIYLDEIQNEIGEVKKIDNKYFITFNKILTKDGKELQSVHSGNINQISLPSDLPKFSFLRVKVEND
jgi:putative protease